MIWKTNNRYYIAALISLALIFSSTILYARKAKVLFIGNSYTSANGLPHILANMAASTGDTLVYEVSAPGGATLQSHYWSTPATMAKIQQGGWDYVVLQEQSQRPAYIVHAFYTWTFPYVELFDSVIHHYNPCAEIIFYMTWGRKNGDPSLCPMPINYNVFCQYHTMDSVTRERYILMADTTNSTVSPIGAVWRYMRYQHPAIDMYDADESHPSAAGSYAGACAFYTAIFKKNPDSINYDFSLSASNAAIIRSAATKVVYDSMTFWNIAKHETFADFTYQFTNVGTVSFTNRSSNAVNYNWDFGNGQSSSAASPTCSYTTPGTYLVRLIATDTQQCSDTFFQAITTLQTSIEATLNIMGFVIAPNPVNNILNIRSTLFAKQQCRIDIMNTTGQLIHQQLLAMRENQQVDVSALTKGIYVVTIVTPKGENFHQKIVIF